MTDAEHAALIREQVERLNDVIEAADDVGISTVLSLTEGGTTFIEIKRITKKL